MSSFIKIRVIPKTEQNDFQIYQSNHHESDYSNSRGIIETVLSAHDLWFVYDMVGEEAPFQMNISNTFSNSIEDMVNGYLSGPLHDLMGMMGKTETTNKVFNEVASHFNMNMTGGDLYSLLFLSKIKQIKIWQNGELSFNLPITVTFHTLGNESFGQSEFIQNSIENVVFPTYLLQLMQGYHRQPSIINVDKNSGWVKTLSELIRVIIGPLNFKIQIGQFFSTDKYSPLQISNLNLQYGMFINGYPTQQTQKFTLVNISPIILEDVPPFGPDRVQPIQSSHTYYSANNNLKNKLNKLK